ncbi:hypothetical protein NDA03_25835 [Trichocoleus sp. Lan]|uniref:hypothetical protein n=1 Tax=Trichocoleus sp. Lan TaxID=2933927 RepID=UPI0032985655
MTTKQFDSADWDLILCQVSGLPPVGWLKRYRTPDQLEHWDATRYHFQLLHAELESFFRGLDRPVYPLAEIDFYFQKAADRYIALYSLLHTDWRAIRDTAAAVGMPLPANCGEALVKILEQDCRAFLGEAEAYSEFRPRKIYNLLQDCRKVEALKKKPNPTAKDLNKIQSVEAQSRILSQHLREGAAIRGFCLAVCLASRNPSVKEKLKIYQRQMAELEQNVLQHFHPSQRVHGHTWNKGFRKSS